MQPAATRPGRRLGYPGRPGHLRAAVTPPPPSPLPAGARPPLTPPRAAPQGAAQRSGCPRERSRGGMYEPSAPAGGEGYEARGDAPRPAPRGSGPPGPSAHGCNPSAAQSTPGRGQTDFAGRPAFLCPAPAGHPFIFDIPLCRAVDMTKSVMPRPRFRCFQGLSTFSTPFSTSHYVNNISAYFGFSVSINFVKGKYLTKSRQGGFCRRSALPAHFPPLSRRFCRHARPV